MLNLVRAVAGRGLSAAQAVQGGLAVLWALTVGRRGLKTAAVGLLVALLSPGLALASPLCDAVNAGAFNQTATYLNGAVTATDSRETIGSSNFNGIITPSWTGPAAARWYGGGATYAHTAGETITISVTVNASAGVLRGSFYRGLTSSTVGSQIQYVESTGSFSYTLPATEYALDARLQQTGSATGTISMTATCASAAPTISSISPEEGPTAGGTSVTLTGTNFTGGTITVDGSTVTPSALSATSATFTTPAHAAGAIVVALTTPGGTATTGYTFIDPPMVTAVSPTAGPTGGGQTVIITGTNFSNATAVTFGGTAATGYTVNGATQITATAPAGAPGTVDIRVTTAGGTSATSAADQYTYVVAPTVNGVSPNAGPTAGGTTVVITGTGFAAAPGTGAVRFGASNATYTINSNTQITATSPANSAGTYDITVTTPGGTSATSAQDQFTYVGSPTVTALSPTSGPTSGGQTVVITGTNLATASAVTFGGTAATGFTVNSSTQITATSPAMAAGTTNVRVTTVGGTSATGAANQYTAVSAPVSSSQTYGSIVAYNDGSNLTTNIDVGLYLTGGDAPTSFAVGSATTAQGGSVSVNSSGIATYTPPVGYRNANDSFTWTATNQGGTSAPATVTITLGNPTISVTLPSGSATVERVYNAGGSPVTFNGGRATYTVNSISGLPSGLTDAGGGVISGSPQVNGVFTVTVNVTDSSLGAGPYNANTTAILSINLPPAPVASSFSISGLTYNSGAATATTFSAAPHTTESPTGYQVGASSYGGSVSVDSAGLMSYTPPVGFRGTDVFNWVATNAGGTSNVGQVFLTVDDPVFAVSLPAATGTVGEAYNTGASAVTMSGGNGPYNNFSATGLPPGLSMDSSGVITGTPTTATSNTIVVTATDSSGGNGSYTSTASATLTIAAPTIILSPGAGALPGAQAGSYYGQTFTTTGGVGPMSHSVTAGALPPGLGLDTNGVLSGTPTATGTYNFTVTATDSSGNSYTGSAAYSITVLAPTITVSPGSLPGATVGAAYSQTFTASGGTGTYSYSVSAGTLPNGLTLTAAGVLSGTPTAGGNFSFTVEATDSTSGGTYTGAQAYTLSVGSPNIVVSGSPAGGTAGNAYSTSLSASGGTAGYTFSLLAGSLPPGLTLATDGTISGTPTGGGTYNFTVTATDSSGGAGPYAGSAAFAITIGAPTITVNPATMPSFQIGADGARTVTASGGVGPYTFSVTTGALPAGVSLAADGQITGTPTSAGAFNFTITATDSTTGAGPYTGSRAYTVNVTAPALTMTPSSLTGMSVGSPFTASITAGGATAPFSYFLYGGTVLPPGLSLASDGTITGTPTAGGAFSFTIAATDSSTGTGAPFTVARAFNVTVAAPVVTLAPTTLVDGRMGTAYDADLTASGGTAPYIYSVTAGALPAGVTLSTAGELTGTPTVHGTYNFTVQARDSSTGAGPYTGSRAYSLVIAVPNPPVAGAVNATVGYNASATSIAAALSGGTADSVAIGTGPSHGAVSVSGLGFVYTPDTGYFGADSFTYTATNDGGTSAPATVSVTVSTPPAPVVSDRSGVAVGYNSSGTAIDLTASVSGVSSSLAVASAPAHGTTSVSGTVVTYTPTAGYFGPDSFTFTATGPGGTSAPATVSLTVATPPPPVVTPPTDPVVVTPPSGGGSNTVTVNLGASTSGVTDDIRIGTDGQNGTASISGDGSAGNPWTLIYTPAANFMGTDTVSVIASGPGGDSAPATFTFQVPGKAPDLSASVLSNASVTISPTAGLVGGPFSAVRITRAPAFGSATVSGLDIIFTPGASNGGSTSLDYVIDLPFGTSAAGRIDLTSNLVPGVQALTAETLQGVPVTVRISNTTGGPFTGAAVVSVGPTTAGTATVAGAGGAWDLTFTPASAFSGQAVVTFSLTNSFGTTNGAATIAVQARPDPSLDPEVTGLATSQVTSARRFADAQINNFQRRLQDLHDGVNGSSNGLSFNVGLGGQADLDNDPREALRRELGQRERVDPGALADDRSREMLGLDLWAGRDVSTDRTGVAGDRLGVLPTSGGEGRGSDVGFWTAGSVDWGRQDAQGQRDYRFTTQGVTAGVDMRLNDQLIVGGGLGYGEDKTKIGNEGSVSNAHAFTGALYASWRPAEAFYIDGVIGWSDLDFSSRRWTTGIGGDPDAFAEGDRSGDSRFLSAAFGRIVKRDTVTSEFYARLDARSITLDAFTETGAGLSSLAWDEVEQDSVSANIGAVWRWVIDDRALGLMRPTARIEWSHEFEDLGDQGVRYADWAASPTYLVPLDAWSRNTIRLDLGGDWTLSERMTLGLGYRGAFGDAGTSHGGEIRLKFGW